VNSTSRGAANCHLPVPNCFLRHELHISVGLHDGHPLLTPGAPPSVPYFAQVLPCRPPAPTTSALPIPPTTRFLGIYATLDEIWAGESEELQQRKAGAAALVEQMRRKQQQRQAGAGVAPAG